VSLGRQSSGRQVAAVVAIVLAGLASLATSYGPPDVANTVRDHLSFGVDQDTQTRHVALTVNAGEGDAVVTMSGLSYAPRIRGHPPVRLSVTDATGKVLTAAPEPSDTVETNLLGVFPEVLACLRGNVCTASYAFTFARVAADTQPTLEMDWDVEVVASYDDIAPGPESTPPPGSSVDVTITP
jgi:hypothetical protein